VSLFVEPANRAPEKGLKSGALGLISSTVIVSRQRRRVQLAATLGFVVVAIGVQSPIVTVLAFVPMFFVSLAFQQMNKAILTVARALPGHASLHSTHWLDGWLGVLMPTSS